MIYKVVKISLKKILIILFCLVKNIKHPWDDKECRVIRVENKNEFTCYS